MMMWMWISSILLGAQLNSEIEQSDRAQLDDQPQ
jgi:hypothetical protein